MDAQCRGQDHRRLGNGRRPPHCQIPPFHAAFHTDQGAINIITNYYLTQAGDLIKQTADNRGGEIVIVGCLKLIGVISDIVTEDDQPSATILSSYHWQVIPDIHALPGWRTLTRNQAIAEVVLHYFSSLPEDFDPEPDVFKAALINLLDEL